MRQVVVLACLLALGAPLGACSNRAETWTLYRNGPADPNARIHFATIDSVQHVSLTYNEENCAVTMELLNANVAQLNEGEHPVRFWCERGTAWNLS